MNCCVPFCKSSRKYITRKYDSVNEINFHNFPNDYDLKEKWLKAIRGEGRDEYFTWQASNRWSYYVCSLHFKAEDFTPCKTHKHLVPGSVPSIFTLHPQSTGQKKISIERIQTSKPENNPSVLSAKKKTFTPEQCKVMGESAMFANAKNDETSNIDNRGKNSNVNDGIENNSSRITAANTSVANNAVTSETEQNCSVSAKTITENNSNQTIVNLNPLTNAIGNTNLSYVGNFEISNSDKKFKNFKVFQCTINPPEASAINMDKPPNNVDMHQTHDVPLPRSDRGTFSTETGDKQNDSVNRSEVSVQDIMKSVFSNTKIRNLLLKNNTTSVNDTVNSKTNYYDELNLNNNSNEDCIPHLNTSDSSLNASQSNSSNQSDKNDRTANHRSHLMLNKNCNNNENNDGDCTTNLNNCNSSVNVHHNDISTLPNVQRMSNIDKWRAATRDQIADLSHSNDILRRHISRLKETVKERQPKLKTRNEMINQYNIEAMEEGIENKDGKSLFLCDQLRSITREQILWSEKSLEFMRQLVRKFPESYDFLKKEDVMYLPNPRILGCKKLRKS